MPLRKEPKASQQPHLSPGTGAEPGAFPCQDSQQCEQNTGSTLQTGAAPRKKHVSYIRHSCFHCHNGLLRWSPSFVLLPDTHLSCRLLPPLALWHWLCPANMLVVFWYGIPVVLLVFSGPAVWTAKSAFQPLSKKSPYSPGRPWSDSWYQNSSEVTQMLSNVSVTTSHLGSPCHNWM